MGDRTERWLLNHLIESCRDEESTLRYAADRVRDPSLKALLMEVAAARARFASDLLPHAQRLGGAGEAGGTMAGALHRRWMAIKGRFVDASDETMIAEAEQAEGRALATYARALDDLLPPTVRDLVERQQTEIHLTHDRVHSLRAH